MICCIHRFFKRSNHLNKLKKMDTSVCDSESIGSDEDTVLNAGYKKKFIQIISR